MSVRLQKLADFFGQFKPRPKPASRRRMRPTRGLKRVAKRISPDERCGAPTLGGPCRFAVSPRKDCFWHPASDSE